MTNSLKNLFHTEIAGLRKTFAFGSTVLVKAKTIGLLEVVHYGILFVASMLKFRYLTPELIGTMSYFASLAESPSAFYGNFNKIIVRFGGGADPKLRRDLFQVALIMQFAVLGVLAAIGLIIFGFFPKTRFWSAHLILQDREIYWLAIGPLIFLPIAILQSGITALTSSLGNYARIQKAKVAVALLQIASLVSIIGLVHDVFRGAHWIMFTQFAFSAANIASLCMMLPKPEKGDEFWSWNPRVVRSRVIRIYLEYVKGYTLPMQFSSIFAFVKENIGVLALGQSGHMSAAGLYTVANRVYSVPRKFIPGLLSLMMPKLVSDSEKDPATFRERYRHFTWWQLSANMGMGLCIFAAWPLIRRVIDFPSIPQAGHVFFLFSLSLSLNAIVQSNIQILMMGKETFRYMLSSIFRAVIVVTITSILTPKMESIGAAIALATSTLFLSVWLTFETRRSPLIHWRTNARQIIICCLFGALLGGTSHYVTAHGGIMGYLP